MSNILLWIGRFAVILALFAGVAWLSDRPIYRQIPSDAAVMLLTFVHSADRRSECRKLSPQEIAKLPMNMRRTQDCPRARRPIYVELDIDGRNVYRASLPPGGIAGDGPSRVYRRFVLPAAQYDVAVRMRDTPRAEGFDHERHEIVRLAEKQMFIIDYRSESGDFIFR
jgi:hypothetical protein